MKLINEITAEVKAAMEAADNAKAWKQIEKDCMKNARQIIATAKRIDPEAAEIDTNTLIEQIKAELTPVEESTDETPTDNTPDSAPEIPDTTETPDKPQ